MVQNYIQLLPFVHKIKVLIDEVNDEVMEGVT